MIWFGWVLWHINHCRLFNAKSSLYIYVKYIRFGLVGFYGISTIVGYLIRIWAKWIWESCQWKGTYIYMLFIVYTSVLQCCTCQGHITFTIYKPRMMAPDQAAGTNVWVGEGSFIKQLPPDIVKSVQQLGRTYKKNISIKHDYIVLWKKKKIYIYIYIYQVIGMIVGVFANGPGDLGSIPCWVLPNTQQNGTWYLLA